MAEHVPEAVAPEKMPVSREGWRGLVDKFMKTKAATWIMVAVTMAAPVSDALTPYQAEGVSKDPEADVRMEAKFLEKEYRERRLQVLEAVRSAQEQNNVNSLGASMIYVTAQERDAASQALVEALQKGELSNEELGREQALLQAKFDEDMNAFRSSFPKNESEPVPADEEVFATMLKVKFMHESDA